MAVDIMTFQGNPVILSGVSGVEQTGPETYSVTEEPSDLLQDLTPTFTRGSTRGSTSAARQLTETVRIYAMAMKKCILIGLLLMTDTTDRMLEIQDSYLAMID